MRKRITIADVAAEAGVSMMTVSRAINHKKGISAATRQRILTLAAEMGYRPSGIARGLATQRTTTIGLLVPDIANPFFAEIARGVEDVAYAHAYNVFLLNSSESVAREEKALESLWSKQVDGLIWCSSRLAQPQLLATVERFAHVVLINREVGRPLPGVVTINVDEAAGTQQALAHFVAQGRRQLAFVAGPSHSLSGQKRQRGFVAACEEHGIPEKARHIVACSPTREGGRRVAAELLRTQPEVDGIFAYNDLVAVGVLEACRANGRLVPEDVALIGVDDIPLAALVSPSLSSLHIDTYGMGDRGMRTLLQLIDSQQPAPRAAQLVQPKLVVRQSTVG